MLNLIDLLFSAGLVAGKALGITLFTLSDVNLPQQLNQVAPVEMSSAPYVTMRLRPKTAEERCRYSGVVVPYEQLWEERTTNVFGIESVTPPQPGKIAAWALIINRKDCDDGRQPEAMFRVATVRPAMFGDNSVLGEGAQSIVLQLTSLPELARPKWVAQVIENLTEAAKTDPVSKEFMRFTEESTKVAATDRKTGYSSAE